MFLRLPQRHRWPSRNMWPIRLSSMWVIRIERPRSRLPRWT